MQNQEGTTHPTWSRRYPSYHDGPYAAGAGWCSSSGTSREIHRSKYNEDDQRISSGEEEDIFDIPLNIEDDIPNAERPPTVESPETDEPGSDSPTEEEKSALACKQQEDLVSNERKYRKDMEELESQERREAKRLKKEKNKEEEKKEEKRKEKRKEERRERRKKKEDRKKRKERRKKADRKERKEKEHRKKRKERRKKEDRKRNKEY